MPVDKTKRLYTKNPDLWTLYQGLIDQGMFREDSVSSRIEKLILDDVRKNAPRARKKGLKIPVEVFQKD